MSYLENIDNHIFILTKISDKAEIKSYIQQLKDKNLSDKEVIELVFLSALKSDKYITEP